MWGTILAATASQAVLLGVLAVLARSLLSQWLGKDLEAFKTKLNAEAELTLENYKAELSRQTREHHVRFEALHANRVAAIEALYVTLVETSYVVASFVLAWRPDNREEFFTVRRQVLELRRELDKRRIHLPEDLCGELDQCIKTLHDPVVAAGIWPDVNSSQDSRAKDEFLKGMQAVLEGGSVEAAVKKLERAFRKALNAEGQESA